MEDPIAVLSEISKAAIERLRPEFKVTVTADYHTFPLILTIRVGEYQEGEAADWEKPFKASLKESKREDE